MLDTWGEAKWRDLGIEIVSRIALLDWLNDWLKPLNICYVKRLSGNDTLANGSHQAGPYIPKQLLFRVFPHLNDQDSRNPDWQFDAHIDSHGEHRQVRAIWYNNRLFGGSRNEARVTNWGGSASALLDPDATGALAAFVFCHAVGGAPAALRVWLCRNPTEEDLIEDRLAPVEPGASLVWEHDQARPDLFIDYKVYGREADCALRGDQLPPDWIIDFPPAAHIIQKVCELRPAGIAPPDERLINRRVCEYELFQAIEEAIEFSNINRSFLSVADFVNTAQRILQRRKARSGRSLELHTRAILLEDGLVEGRDFSHQPESEAGKHPDFLFPSEIAYKSALFPGEGLRMLAVKTTCKDRWRQILNEADRVTKKHLLTLQEGVSLNQHTEMRASGVQLVVPKALFAKYPEIIRPSLLSLEHFLREVRSLAQAYP